VKEDTASWLALAGQDADFFLCKHASGDWGEEDPARQERALQNGLMVVSSYKTLRGFKVYVFTTGDRKTTGVFVPVNHVPLPDFAHGQKPEHFRYVSLTDPKPAKKQEPLLYDKLW